MERELSGLVGLPRANLFVVMSPAWSRYVTLHILSLSVLTSSQEYWQGLAAGTYFSNRYLNACVGVIRQEVVKIRPSPSRLPRNLRATRTNIMSAMPSLRSLM